MPPSPFRQHCPACDWRGGVIAPRGDALSPADCAILVEACPRCGATTLKLEAASGIAAVLARLGRLTGRMP